MVDSCIMAYSFIGDSHIMACSIIVIDASCIEVLLLTVPPWPVVSHVTVPSWFVDLLETDASCGMQCTGLL